MKIYFDKNQFPNALEECNSNNNIVILSHDIEFIPSYCNQVIIDANENDREDWQHVRDNWELFINYFITVISEEHADDEDFFEDYVDCMDVFEFEFIITEK